MEISPCRHTGSVYNDNLVVAGHNYKTEFDVLFRLETGDTVTFTDMDGNAQPYFSYYPLFGLPAEVEDCDILYLNDNPAKI